jgi:hypothetical protein
MSSLTGAEIQVLLADAAERAGRYLAGLDSARWPRPGGAGGLARLDEPLPELAGHAAATLALLDAAGSPATVPSAGDRYFGFVTGDSYPVALAAGWPTTAWDQNAALPVMSPVAARMHEGGDRMAGRPARPAAGHRRDIRDRGRPLPTRPPLLLLAISSRPGPAGTCRPTGCSARRS